MSSEISLDGGAPYDIIEVHPLKGTRLRLVWSNGEATEHDLSGDLERPVFAPLRKRSLFARVEIAYNGRGLSWPGTECDLSADTLWYEAHPERNPWPQASKVYADEFKAWRKGKGWTQTAAAAALGISVRSVRAYEKADLPVSRTVALAMQGIDAQALGALGKAVLGVVARHRAAALAPAARGARRKSAA